MPWCWNILTSSCGRLWTQWGWWRSGRGSNPSPPRQTERGAPSAKRTANKPGVARLRGFTSPRRYWHRQAKTWLAFTPCALRTRRAPESLPRSGASALGCGIVSCLWEAPYGRKQHQSPRNSKHPSNHQVDTTRVSTWEECLLKSNPSRRPKPNAYKSLRCTARGVSHGSRATCSPGASAGSCTPNISA